MRVRRLGWAGLQIESSGSTVVIDLVEESEPLRSVLPAGSLLPASRTADIALVTHLHSDHADPAAIERAVTPGGAVLRPEPFAGTRAETLWTNQAEDGFAQRDLNVQTVRDWQVINAGPFEITAVPAVDGLGDPQVNWVVAADGKRVFHGGDTVFHGLWWLIQRRLGPVDAAFLPINGAAVDFPHLRPPSPLPAVLTPEQAVVAGSILRAAQVVPIHYGIDQPGVYEEVDDPATAFQHAAKRHGVEARMLAPGETIDL
ncbi:L-ascorbate metabolism protein UlaG (beta-lactamase superfamily) [Kibdelosporangium banguiense]|uniref:L-ascorbate metabolism protein UlaG (Beta-lactamase superfamily) n=1 Tax=Kibdelosporangium banguiense TaxID=1365924 RepID=A0ABS4U453_9PSEU|nr:MBL fold metallo-hydrolase [Kibdelosporangium banguiense]MBP2330984.1 L-ascorbate metabolism protein UlaG (beta-lactamase superfamily) [Kibdelosporangium banguiense]